MCGGAHCARFVIAKPVENGDIICTHNINIIAVCWPSKRIPISRNISPATASADNLNLYGKHNYALPTMMGAINSQYNSVNEYTYWRQEFCTRSNLYMG